MSEPKVFISHSRGDSEWVRQFAEALRKQDVDVWIDEWQIKPGDLLQEKIEDGLRSSDAIVSVLTRSNAQSPDVAFEFGAAIGMGKRFIPIISADVETAAIPPAYRRRRYLTLGEPEEAAREVAQALKEDAT